MSRADKYEQISSQGENEELRAEHKKLMGYEEYVVLNAKIYTLWLEQKIVELQSKHKKLEAAFINHAPNKIVRQYFNI
ncbi:hypothetical protein LCGC14_3069810 [marine sediment metagenome]|uniref:Uncharacterized protein n=1 Tax=marine sediment metagenome TaxID=412755 RepID=A0A0F8Z726_9ZZZZ